MTYRACVVTTTFVFLLFVFGGCAVGEEHRGAPKPASEESQQDMLKVANPMSKGHSSGNPNRRTWVVYEYSEFEDQHLSPGDAFRIQKTGPKYKMLPLTALRKRWKKDDGFIVDLVEKGDDLLCGQVTLTGHETDKDHIFKFLEISADELEVLIEVRDASKTLEDQCVAASFIHGGRAHAEN